MLVIIILVHALDSMKCVAAVKRKGVVPEEDIYIKFLTSFSLMKNEIDFGVCGNCVLFS
ncbi:unnamed protein product [Trifolium pratense]|uniref:Uncharacterized protein n=1 Tax=Trifolium pratense TaxID=57577 RepID=A0ACB0JBG0_TRIPR|nr:unnamed protein product [Trifolium pratense]